MSHIFSKTLICLSLAGTSVIESKKTGADGIVNIDGKPYAEEKIQDPVVEIKAELVAEQLAELQKIDQGHVDYSNIQASELLTLALGTMSNNILDATLEALANRPEEMKTAIDDFLNNEKSFYAELLSFSRLPSLARKLGSDYEVEVTKRILDHPLAKKYDKVLLEDKTSSMVGGGLLNHLAASGNDETGVIDKLVDEGRIKRGSEQELKWNRLLSGGERKKKDRPKTYNPQDTRGGDLGTGGIQIIEADRESSLDSSYFVLGGMMVVLGLIILLFKPWKARSKR